MPLAQLLNSNMLRVTSYLICAGVCAYAAFREHRAGAPYVPSFWWVLTALLLFLGIARNFDIGPQFTDLGRHYAKVYDLYRERRPAQRLAIDIVTVTGLLAIATAFIFSHARWRRYRAPFVIFVGLCMFVTVRAISLHQVDQVLYNHPIGGVRVSSLLELNGIALLTAVAAMPLRDPEDEAGKPNSKRSGATLNPSHRSRTGG